MHTVDSVLSRLSCRLLVRLKWKKVGVSSERWQTPGSCETDADFPARRRNEPTHSLGYVWRRLSAREKGR